MNLPNMPQLNVSALKSQAMSTIQSRVPGMPDITNLNVDSIKTYAMNMISQMPAVQSSPWAQAGIQAIQNGDTSAGVELANNLCQTYGISKEDALAQAAQYFNLGDIGNLGL